MDRVFQSAAVYMNGFPLLLAGQDRIDSVIIASCKQVNLLGSTQQKLSSCARNAKSGAGPRDPLGQVSSTWCFDLRTLLL